MRHLSHYFIPKQPSFDIVVNVYFNYVNSSIEFKINEHTLFDRGVRGAVWAVLTQKIIRTAREKGMRFGLVRLTFRKKTKPNQTKPMRFGSVRLVRFFTNNLLSHTFTYI